MELLLGEGWIRTKLEGLDRLCFRVMMIIG